MPLDPQDYDYWHASLAGDRPSMNEGNPQCGYYFEKSASGMRNPQGSTRTPIAVWRAPNGDLIGIYGYDNIAQYGVNDAWLRDSWVRFGGNAISEATYERARKDGRFPDDLPAEAFSAPPKAPTSDGEARPNAAKASPSEELRDQIDAAIKQSKAVTAIANDEAMAVAVSYRARLNELGGNAEKRRKKEKEPHLAAGTLVDRTWNPLVKDAEAEGQRIAKLVNTYLTQKDRDAKAVVPAPQVATGGDADTVASVPAPAVPVATPAPTQVKGGYGRAAAVVDVIVSTVTDYAAFAAWAIAEKDAGVLLALDEAAKRCAKLAGLAGAIPGVSITSAKAVR